jgi:hypothetical protein
MRPQPETTGDSQIFETMLFHETHAAARIHIAAFTDET